MKKLSFFIITILITTLAQSMEKEEMAREKFKNDAVKTAELQMQREIEAEADEIEQQLIKTDKNYLKIKNDDCFLAKIIRNSYVQNQNHLNKKLDYRIKN